MMSGGPPAKVLDRDLIAAGAVMQITIGGVVVQASLALDDLANLRAALTPPVLVTNKPCQHICQRLRLTSTSGQRLTAQDLEQLRQGLDRLLAP